jgi:hypothetical protein
MPKLIDVLLKPKLHEAAAFYMKHKGGCCKPGGERESCTCICPCHTEIMMQVPQTWAKVAYPCLKPLGSWFQDYLRRVSFMRTWLTERQPSCFWLPGFFFPQGFLTGVLQVHARKYTIPIDTLAFQFSVTDKTDATEACPHCRCSNFVSLLLAYQHDTRPAT